MRFSKQRISLSDVQFACSVLVLVIGITGFLGYLPGLRILGCIRESYIPMAPSTAVGFLSVATVAFFLRSKPLTKKAQIVCGVLAGMTTLFGLLEALEFFTATSLTFEELLVGDMGTLKGTPIARMSPATGAAFFLAGLASLLFSLFGEAENDAVNQFASALGISTALTGAVFATAYAYGHPLLYDQPVIPMALTTALGFLFSGAALICTSRRDLFPLNLFVGETARAYLIRFILPVTMASVLLGQLVGHYSSGHGSRWNPALLAVFISLLLSVAAAFLSIFLSRKIGERIDRSNETVRKMSETLRERVKELGSLYRVAELGNRPDLTADEILQQTAGLVPPAFVHPADTFVRISYGPLEFTSDPFRETETVHSEPLKSSSQEIGRIDVFLDGAVFLPEEIDFLRALATQLMHILKEKRLDEELQQSLERQTALNEELARLACFPAQNPNPVLRLSEDGDVLYANAAGRELVEKMQTENNRLLPENFDIPLSEMIREGRVFRQEIDCGEMAYAISFAPVPNEPRMNLYAMEISDRQKAERELAVTVRELQNSNRDLEQFAYAASHDLQEPLRMVANYVQLIERRYEDKLDQDGKEFIAFAVDGAVRMQKLIDSLLQYSRLNSREKPFSTVNLNEVFRRVLRDMERRIVETGAQIYSDSLPEVYGNAEQLGLVLQNLISNAVKFCDADAPQVWITSEKTGDGWKISVKDKGLGIEPEHQERIFKIFQRLHARADFPGTGIGLSICKRIIERHAGKIGVESAPKEGSTFWFTLPWKGEYKGGNTQSD